MVYSKENMGQAAEQGSEERRRIQNAELEALVKPNHREQLDLIIKRASAGEIGEEEALFAARQILIEVASIDTKTGLKKGEALKNQAIQIDGVFPKK